MTEHEDPDELAHADDLVKFAAATMRPERPVMAVDHEMTDEALRELFNRERSQRRGRTLLASAELRQAAQTHAAYMASRDRLDHFGPRRQTWADRAAEAGYPGANLRTIGENVAGWQTSPAMVLGDYRQSPGHWRTILDPRWEHDGHASATSRSGRTYWCSVFGFQT